MNLRGDRISVRQMVSKVGRNVPRDRQNTTDLFVVMQWQDVERAHQPCAFSHPSDSYAGSCENSTSGDNRCPSHPSEETR